MTSAYAPFDTSYAVRTPYISATEYNNSPTSMDTSNLIAGNAEANLTALIETIGRASSWVDQYTCGAWGTLNATLEIGENARVWGSYRSTLLVHPKYWPITEVTAFAYSSQPGGLAAGASASITPSGNITIYPQEFEVAVTGAIGWGVNSPGGTVFRQQYDVQYSYVCGWANTALSASVAAGATSFTPTTTTGIYPGMVATIYDLPNDESVQVAPSYVPGATVVPLVSPLTYGHPTTATFSSLPPAIKQATILATTAFIKQRGSGALVVADMGATTHQQTGFSQNSGSDWSEAEYLLTPYRQQYVGW